MGFKQKGFFYKVEDFMNNTIPFNEIISDAIYNETKSLIYYEPIAQQIGRCFSLKNHSGYEAFKGPELFFKLNYGLKIIIHDKGVETWISGFQVFPFEVATVLLEITKRSDYSLATLSIKEVQTVLHTQPDIPCIDYDIESDIEHELALFSNCCKESLWKNISKNISCTIAEIRHIVPKNSEIQECNDSSVANDVYWTYANFLDKFVPQPSAYGCPIPCRQNFYQVKLQYFHANNAWIPPQSANYSKGHFLLVPFFTSFTSEEKIESLEYDLARLLVSAGGNLGLFLGFSCLSVFFTIIEWVFKKIALHHL